MIHAVRENPNKAHLLGCQNNRKSRSRRRRHAADNPLGVHHLNHGHDYAHGGHDCDHDDGRAHGWNPPSPLPHHDRANNTRERDARNNPAVREALPKSS